MLLVTTSLSSFKTKGLPSNEITITWADSVIGDFSFINDWDYPEGVYRNQFGQLSCDGLCPPESYSMKDENGKIYQDSLAAFYQMIDTTHLYHSIQSEAWTYEWSGTDYVTAYNKNTDTTVCFTHNSVATHSSLNLIITKNKCIPVIVLNSITPSGIRTYKCIGGGIEIDKTLWNKGILKATFNFDFEHPEHPDTPMYWKGKIYRSIDKKN
jgi:hypothetical protein